MAEASIRPQYFRDAARRALPALMLWGQNERLSLEELQTLQGELAIVYSQVKIEVAAGKKALADDRRHAAIAATVAACAEVLARRTVKPVSQDYLDDVAPAFTGDEVQDFPQEAA